MHLEYSLKHYYTNNNLLEIFSPPKKVIFKKSLRPLNYFQYLLDKQESFKNKSFRLLSLVHILFKFSIKKDEKVKIEID
jgi:hypothetical protein